MARPTLLSDDLTLQVCENLEQGISITDACALNGIGETTYHRWIEQGKADEGKDEETPFREFWELTRRARARGRAGHVDAIRKASANDWRAAAFFLERSDPRNWGRRARVKADPKKPRAKFNPAFPKLTEEEEREVQRTLDEWKARRMPGKDRRSNLELGLQNGKPPIT